MLVTQLDIAVPATQLDSRLKEHSVRLNQLTKKEQSARLALEQRKIEVELTVVQTRIAAEVAAIKAHTARK